jgi:hypothetical protein
MQMHGQNLSYADKQDLMSSFPNIKLCYDNIIHNKVENVTKNVVYDLCSAIPCGKKCFTWFTQLHNKNVCLVLELIDKKNINDIKKYNCVFNNELVYGKYGTIFYGTLFHYSQTPFFTIEDVFYCKGDDVTCNNWSRKFNILSNVFSNDIKQIAYNKTFVVFGLPLMARDTEELKTLLEDVQYKIYNVQFRCFDKTNNLDSILLSGINNVVKISGATPAIPESKQEPLRPEPQPQPHTQPQIPPKTQSITQTLPKNIIFKVKADIQNDIYHLYCMENNKEIFYNVAYIPDYKTSVMMNKLFRNIKENDNLDLLEESDDEEEFQNENIDRFVDVNKSHLMICKFNHKFKKWYPVKDFSNQNPLIVEKKDLGDCEKNNYSQYHNNNNYNNTNTNFQNKKYNIAPRQYQYQYQHQNKRPFHAQNSNQNPNYVKVK